MTTIATKLPRSIILYSVIAYESKILAEASIPLCRTPEYEGALQRVLLMTKNVLQKIFATGNFTKSNKKTYISKQVNFHYVIEDSLIYLCVTDSELEQIVAFAYLKSIHGEWNNKYNQQACISASPYQMSFGFERTLIHKMLYFSDKSAGKIEKMKDELEITKVVIMDSVDKVLERGASLEELEEKARQIERDAESFKHHTEDLQDTLDLMPSFKPLKKWKFLVPLGVCICLLVVGVIIYGIGIATCGGAALPDCIGMFQTD